MSADENQNDPIINDQNLYQAFQMMQRKEYDNAESFIKKGIKAARDKNDENLEGLYYSAMGVLYKLKNDYKKSYKFYQQAEKILKDDHSIKIISALLLIEQFKQYDTAERKLQKVIDDTQDPAIWHHAKAIQAIAFFSQGKKDQAFENLEILLKQKFSDLRFVANVDFKMVEFFVAKKFKLDECRTFLNKALKLAETENEKTYQLVIKNLLKLL